MVAYVRHVSGSRCIAAPAFTMIGKVFKVWGDSTNIEKLLSEGYIGYENVFKEFGFLILLQNGTRQGYWVDPTFLIMVDLTEDEFDLLNKLNNGKI